LFGAVVIFSSCDLFGPKQVPIIPKTVRPDSVAYVNYVLMIRVDGHSFHVINDTLHLTFSNSSKVDSVLPSLVTGSADSSVVVTWKGDATYGNVIEVVDVLKKNGISKYTLTKE
jgi:biopolymer transport protein ExbD